jgi:hypothetical protein
MVIVFFLSSALKLNLGATGELNAAIGKSAAIGKIARFPEFLCVFGYG